MAIYKSGKWYWMYVVINGHRDRESLNTTDGRKAPGIERNWVARLRASVPDPTKKSKTMGSMKISEAVEFYNTERRSQVSTRMVDYWRDQCKPLVKSEVLRNIKLSKITPALIATYQSERRDEGRVPKTINGEVSVLRQLLKHARIWHLFQQDYKPVPNTRPPVGKALTHEEAARLFEVARTRSDWTYAYVAATLSFYCGMRACEIRGLLWKHIDWEKRLIEIKRSKTAAGWRTPSLNNTCYEALHNLFVSVAILNATEPDHYVFPWRGREQKIDPTKPMTSWRTAWRSMRQKCGAF